jgi:hypothetical protein
MLWLEYIDVLTGQIFKKFVILWLKYIYVFNAADVHYYNKGEGKSGV